MLLAGAQAIGGEEKLVVNEIKHFHSHEPRPFYHRPPWRGKNHETGAPEP
jgi:hypothetical protein